jgi:hypothetical protein
METSFHNSKKDIAVVFNKNNARIVKGEKAKELSGLPGVVLNPDVSHITKIPPHFWKLEDGVIREMTRPEKMARLDEHKLYGVDVSLPEIAPILVKAVAKKRAIPAWAKWLGFGALGAAAVLGALQWLT